MRPYHWPLMKPCNLDGLFKASSRASFMLTGADRRYGPVLLAKIDIADGFYRVWLQIEDIS